MWLFGFAQDMDITLKSYVGLTQAVSSASFPLLPLYSSPAMIINTMATKKWPPT